MTAPRDPPPAVDDELPPWDGAPMTRERAFVGLVLRRLTNEAVLAWVVAAFDVPLRAACALAAAAAHPLARLAVAPPPRRARSAALRLEWLLLGGPAASLAAPLRNAGLEVDARDERVWWLELTARRTPPPGGVP